RAPKEEVVPRISWSLEQIILVSYIDLSSMSGMSHISVKMSRRPVKITTLFGTNKM
ncbi:MAG: hypothetical protein EZS28_034272, partial [Streblomastix strix]